MFIFCICLIFGCSVQDAILYSATINFWCCPVLSLCVFYNAIDTDKPQKIIASLILLLGMPYYSIFYHLSTDALPAIGFMLIVGDIMTWFLRYSLKD